METENNLIKFKFIVYQTTNLINNKIYLGVHKTINPDVFDSYLGCGVISTQPYTYQYAKTAFQYAVKKYGPQNFKRTTLAVFDDEASAYALERELVNEDFLARDDVYNMILGGVAGLYESEQIKVYQYSEDGLYLNEYASMAQAALQYGCGYTAISNAVHYKMKAKGYFWNTDKVEKLDLSQYNLGINQRKKVYCYDAKGNFLKEYPSQTKAANDLNSSIGTIGKACKLGTMVSDHYVCWVKGNNYSEARKQYIDTRPVYQYSSTGELIKEFDSQLEAEIETGCNVQKSIRLKIADKNGNYWGVEKVNNYNSPRKHNAPRQIGMFDETGKLVKTYKSASEAAKFEGNAIWHALSGRNKSHKGFICKYLS